MFESYDSLVVSGTPMPESTFKLLQDLKVMQEESTKRRIVHVSRWCSELMYAICQSPLYEEFITSNTIGPNLANTFLNPSTTSDTSVDKPGLAVADDARLSFIQSCFDCREFSRASWLAKQRPSSSESHPVLKYMQYYGQYLANEKTQLETSADMKDKSDYLRCDESEQDLLLELSKLHEESGMDSWLLYLYGIVLAKEGMKEEAIAVLVESLQAHSMFWGPWEELAHLIPDVERLATLQLPNCWLRPLFLAEVHVKLHSPADALNILEPLLVDKEGSRSAFTVWPSGLNQLAVAHHCCTPPELDRVLELFDQIHELDPYRLDGLDLYSNTLFVKDLPAQLAKLAHHAFSVNKFCPESTCVVGNYFSMLGEHERAIQYFQRALKLDPRNAGAWVLIGHEFLQLQNQSAATLAYSNAIEADRRDYRAWYGLGLGYEMAKMPSWALYYYRQAHRLRPLDSRFLVALGDIYESLSKYSEAMKAFWKAHSVGDVEGMALIKLGKLYETKKNKEQAAAVYSLFLDGLEQQDVTDNDNKPDCCRFLATYCLENDRLDEAHKYAQDCLQFDKTKEEATEILKRISTKRNDSMNIDSDSPTPSSPRPLSTDPYPE